MTKVSETERNETAGLDAPLTVKQRLPVTPEAAAPSSVTPTNQTRDFPFLLRSAPYGHLPHRRRFVWKQVPSVPTIPSTGLRAG